MTENSTKCIECGGETHAIKIIDRGQRNIHYDLIYTMADSKRSIFKGHPEEGKIAAEMCENCGRIALRGQPK